MAFSGMDAEPVFMALQESMMLKPMVKLAIAFPLSYHLLGGIRHLAWDSVWGHEISQVNVSSYGIIGGATAISLILAMVEIEE
jgi:succinate dehydrogenase/fumarate reductase cytochrome b subunit